MSDTPQSERLVALAETMFTFGQSDEGDPFAVDSSEPGIVIPLRGRFRSCLAALYRRNNGKPPSAGPLSDAMTVLTGVAQDAPRSPVSLRVARDGNALVVDLGNPDNARCVVIEAGTWNVKDHPPAGVLFRRTALTAALPEPDEPGTGDLARLYELTNVPAADEAVLSAWLVSALVPEIPHPPLAIQGQQGTAKTTTGRCMVRTVDPSPAPLRTAARSLDEWAIAANGSWVVGIDNVSGLSPTIQDAICRTATGDGLVRRELYTDAGLAVLSYKRCVLLTGIDLGALRGDLADRTLLVHPDPIRPEARRLDAEIEAAFTDAWPTITAGLYDLTAQVLELLSDVHLENAPRMADFARIVAAVDAATGTTGLARYAEHARDLADEVLEADTVAGAVRAFMADRTAWTGTASDLLAALPAPTPTPKSWPTTPHHLSARLRRTLDALAGAGIVADLDQRTASGRSITLTRGAHDANDAHLPFSYLGKKKERKKERPASASQASASSTPDHDLGPSDDVPDHTLDAAPPFERVPDHVLAQWEDLDTRGDEA